MTGTTADQQTRLQRALWEKRAEALGLPIAVPPCPFDDDALHELHRDGRAVAYLPAELSSHITRHRFSTLFPDMGSYAVPPVNGFVNTADIWGWFDYEAAIDAPLVDLTEEQVHDALAGSGRALLTLDQYIVASQDQFSLTGHHLDERRSWIRLATSYDGRTVAARFDGPEPEEGREDEPPMPGALLVGYDLMATDHGRMLGVRTRSAHPSPQTEWNQLWSKTVEAYIAAGFPDRLGMSASVYASSLPVITAQPPEYRGQLDIPLVIEPRIPWREQAEMLGVRVSNHSRRFAFEPVDPSPRVPYIGWFNAWNARFEGPISSIDARAALAEHECGATPAELLAMNAALPDLARTTRFFEAIGVVKTTPTSDDITNRSADRCLCLYSWRGGPEIGANQHPISYPMFRPLIRGRRVSQR
ncbi:hypothetical protein [Amycolatopsis sp. GM8]|uniref:hypothetical protein n=1 Tax=Amycolatopsis sp. GM8 TaxID=2896530 RepID=UPI001F3191CF|nr:hypothetical protein [Amycolatopsis sp. GM8]